MSLEKTKLFLAAPLRCVASDEHGPGAYIALPGGPEEYFVSILDLCRLATLCSDKSLKKLFQRPELWQGPQAAEEQADFRNSISALVDDGYLTTEDPKVVATNPGGLPSIPLMSLEKPTSPPRGKVIVAQPLIVHLLPDGSFEAWSTKARKYISLDVNSMQVLWGFAEHDRVDSLATASEVPKELLWEVVVRLFAAGLVELGGGYKTHNSKPAPKGDVPIFVIGCPRSGTTLLRNVLDRHPRIACTPELLFLNQMETFLGQYHNTMSPLSFAASIGVMPSAFRRHVREFFEGLIETRARQYRKPRWADKTPFYWHLSESIYQLFEGEVQFVRIVRHGLDVANSIASTSERNEMPLELFQSSDGRGRDMLSNPTLLGCQTWATVNERLDRFCTRRPAHCHTVRYEDLVTNADATCNAMFDFLGEEYDPRLWDLVYQNDSGGGRGDPSFGGWGQVHARSIGAWKSWCPDLTRSVVDIVEPMLRTFDYEVPDV